MWKKKKPVSNSERKVILDLPIAEVLVPVESSAKYDKQQFLKVPYQCKIVGYDDLFDPIDCETSKSKTSLRVKHSSGDSIVSSASSSPSKESYASLTPSETSGDSGKSISSNASSKGAEECEPDDVKCLFKRMKKKKKKDKKMEKAKKKEMKKQKKEEKKKEKKKKTKKKKIKKDGSRSKLKCLRGGGGEVGVADSVSVDSVASSESISSTGSSAKPKKKKSTCCGLKSGSSSTLKKKKSKEKKKKEKKPKKPKKPKKEKKKKRSKDTLQLSRSDSSIRSRDSVSQSISQPGSVSESQSPGLIERYRRCMKNNLFAGTHTTDGKSVENYCTFEEDLEPPVIGKDGKPAPRGKCFMKRCKENRLFPRRKERKEKGMERPKSSDKDAKRKAKKEAKEAKLRAKKEEKERQKALKAKLKEEKKKKKGEKKKVEKKKKLPKKEIETRSRESESQTDIEFPTTVTPPTPRTSDSYGRGQICTRRNRCFSVSQDEMCQCKCPECCCRPGSAASSGRRTVDADSSTDFGGSRPSSTDGWDSNYGKGRLTDPDSRPSIRGSEGSTVSTSPSIDDGSTASGSEPRPSRKSLFDRLSGLFGGKKGGPSDKSKAGDKGGASGRSRAGDKAGASDGDSSMGSKPSRISLLERLSGIFGGKKGGAGDKSRAGDASDKTRAGDASDKSRSSSADSRPSRASLFQRLSGMFGGKKAGTSDKSRGTGDRDSSVGSRPSRASLFQRLSGMFGSKKGTPSPSDTSVGSGKRKKSAKGTASKTGLLNALRNMLFCGSSADKSFDRCQEITGTIRIVGDIESGRIDLFVDDATKKKLKCAFQELSKKSELYAHTKEGIKNSQFRKIS